MADQEQIDELIEKMERERARLTALLSELREDAAEEAPDNVEGEAQWSAKQQCSHLAEMESAYRAWVEAGLKGENPNVTETRGAKVSVPLEQAHAYPLAQHLESMTEQRVQTLSLIRGMRPDQFDRPATHNWFGTLTLMQWLRSYYRHDRMHADQISGREPEYKPNFTTGQEPDQRRTRLQ